MNLKALLTSTMLICAVVMLSPWINLPTYATNSTNFLPTDTFAIPENNSTIAFACNGSYETATLVNSTWVFTNLQLTPSNLTSNDDPLSNSPNTGNLGITAQDCNITITSFDRLLIQDPSDINNTGDWLTPGWLNYTVTGVGNQTVKMQFGTSNWTTTSTYVGTNSWPVGVYAVFIDGKNTQYNDGWTDTVDDEGMIANGTGIVINRATSNVSIEYAWVPVPTPASTISPEKSPVPIGVSVNYSVFYAVAAAIIVFAAVATTDLLLRLKKKQKTHEQLTEEIMLDQQNPLKI